MPDKESDTIFLEQYKATAERLQKGLKVSNEALMAYHGTTGLLLADVYGRLWSREDLAQTVDGSIKEYCRSCGKAEKPRTFTGQLWEMARANARTIIVCATVLVGLAIMKGNLGELREFFHGAAQDAVSMAK